MKRIKIHKRRNHCPHKIEKDVVPQIAFKCAADNKGDCSGQVKDEKELALKRNRLEHDQPIRAKDCNRSVPVDEIGEDFEHEGSITEPSENFQDMNAQLLVL